MSRHFFLHLDIIIPAMRFHTWVFLSSCSLRMPAKVKIFWDFDNFSYILIEVSTKCTAIPVAAKLDSMDMTLWNDRENLSLKTYACKKSGKIQVRSSMAKTGISLRARSISLLVLKKLIYQRNKKVRTFFLANCRLWFFDMRSNFPNQKDQRLKKQTFVLIRIQWK